MPPDEPLLLMPVQFELRILNRDADVYLYQLSSMIKGQA